MELIHPHYKEEEIIPGDVVPVTMGFWPTGMVFEEGESLQLVQTGFDQTLPGFEVLRGKHINLNKGRHIIHTGANMYDSKRMLPFDLNVVCPFARNRVIGRKTAIKSYPSSINLQDVFRLFPRRFVK